MSAYGCNDGAGSPPAKASLRTGISRRKALELIGSASTLAVGPIAAASPYPAKKRVQAHGLSMAYQEVGEGDPIVLLHGNPTSSFLWRNIIPRLRGLGRCIAPDLIGMGDSDKLADPGPGSYGFVENRRYLDAFFEALDLTRNVTLVVHDWGGALGFDRAMRHPRSIKGIAHMETILPMRWEEMSPIAQTLFHALRSPQGDRLVLEENQFIERNLPLGIFRTLSKEEMAEYRRPFLRVGEDRRPTLTWPRELPIDGEPIDVASIVETYCDWLADSSHPKLHIKAEPGTYSERMITMVRSWPNQREVAVAGRHYPQEDSPDEVGQAIADWLRDI